MEPPPVATIDLELRANRIHVASRAAIGLIVVGAGISGLVDGEWLGIVALVAGIATSARSAGLRTGRLVVRDGVVACTRFGRTRTVDLGQLAQVRSTFDRWGPHVHVRDETGRALTVQRWHWRGARAWEAAVGIAMYDRDEADVDVDERSEDRLLRAVEATHPGLRLDRG